MISTMRGSTRMATASSTKAQAVRPVTCRAASTAWDSWNTYVGKRTAQQKPGTADTKISSEVGAAIKTAAANFKQSNSSAATSSFDSGTFKIQHVDKVPTKLPDGLHEKLETINLQQLKAVLGKETIDAASVSYTTTDVNGALCITGAIVQQGGDKVAHIAFVATETERQASWSRLEGLLLHWGCSDRAGGAWSGPPSGWTSSPAKLVDAGGASESFFEKRKVPGSQEQVYVLSLQLPVRGSLKSGGLQFVLKAKDAQNTKWLKDVNTDRDFFVDIQQLPVTKD